MSSESAPPETVVPAMPAQSAAPSIVSQEGVSAVPDAGMPIMIKLESTPSETSILAPEKISMGTSSGLTSEVAETTPEPALQPVSASSTASNLPSKPKADALAVPSEPTAAVTASGHQYVVMLQSDPSGKLVGTLPPGFTAAAGGTVRPNITLKRGASKTTMMTATGPSQSSISKPMTITGAAKPAFGATVTRPFVSGTSQAVKTVTVPSVTTSSGVIPGVTQIFLPAVSSTAPPSTSTPAPSAVAAVTPTVKPPVKASTVVKTKPSAANGTAASTVNGAARSVTVKTGMLSNGTTLGTGISTGVVKKIPSKSSAAVVPPKAGVKTASGHTIMTKVLNKPLTAFDRALQQKRALSESVTKFRKVEKAMIANRPDQTTPFTYAEIFHHAAVSFSKMASLTTHVSLESQTSMEQRRWTPELINKFVNSINTFATSLKEVGDELKKKHEQQIVVNLKRKAETELANAKKLATAAAHSQDGTTPKTTPNVMNSFLASVASSAATAPATTKPADVETEESPKHPLSITTDANKPSDTVAQTPAKPAEATPFLSVINAASVPDRDLTQPQVIPQGNKPSTADVPEVSANSAVVEKPDTAVSTDASAIVTEDVPNEGSPESQSRTEVPAVKVGSLDLVPQASGATTETVQTEQDVELPDFSATPDTPVAST